MRNDFFTEKYVSIIIKRKYCVIYAGMCMWQIVYIGVIMGKLQQGIWMLLGKSFRISEGKPQSLLFTMYLLNIVYSIYFIVYIYSILREYIYLVNIRYIDFFFLFSQKLISKFKAVSELKVEIIWKGWKPQAITIQP